MSPESYRYYRLDSAGRLYSADWFDAGSDAEAVAYVEARRPDGLCEIWLGNRLVTTLSPKRLSA